MVTKYLIQDKSNILYTIKDSQIIQLENNNLTEDLFLNKGFDDSTIITKEILLSKFDSVDGLKLLVYTDDLEKDKCEMSYNLKPYRAVDKLKTINDGKFDIVMKEIQ